MSHKKLCLILLASAFVVCFIGLTAAASNGEEPFDFTPRQITTHLSDDLSPSVSPDGKWVAFVSRRSGNLDIWVKSTHGGRTFQITRHQADDFSPTWNPDGNKIAFVSKRADAEGDVWTINVKRQKTAVQISGKPRQITNELGRDLFPDFSPDGSNLVFASSRLGVDDIWITSLKSRTHKKLALEGGTHPVWSPDGRHIAFTSLRAMNGGNGDIYVAAVARDVREAGLFVQESYQLTDGPALDGFPNWSPDGSELVFCRFAFDTNHDGQVTPDDRPAILRVEFTPNAALRDTSQNIFIPRPGEPFWITSSARADFLPYWGIDGNIYYASNLSDNLDIWRLHANGYFTPANNAADQYNIAITEFPLTVGLEHHDKFVDDILLFERILALKRVSDFFPKERKWIAHALLETAKTCWALGYGDLSRNTLQQINTSYIDQRDVHGLAALVRIEFDATDGIISHAQALQQIDTLLSRYENLPGVAARALLKKATLLEMSGSYTDALSMLSALAEKYPSARVECAESQFRVAKTLTLLGRKDDAINAYLVILKLYPEQRDLVERATEKILLSDEEATTRDKLELYRSLIGQYESDLPEIAAEAQLRIGKLLLTTGDYESARTELQAVIDNYPDQPKITVQAILFLAEAYQQTGDWLKATSLLESMITEYQNTADSSYVSFAKHSLVTSLVHSADELLRENYYDLAAARYRRAWQYEPRNIDAHRGYIQSQYLSRRIDSTIEEYERVSATNTDNEIFIYALGLCYSYKATEYADLYGQSGVINTTMLNKSNEIIRSALEENYRLVHAYLTLSFNYEMLETHETIQKAKKHNWFVGIVKTFTAPVVSVVRTITFWKEKEPQRNYEKAIDALIAAIGLNDETVEPKLEGQLCRNLANNYYNLAEFGFKRAYEYYQRSMQFDSTFSSRLEEAIIKERMGHCAVVTEDFINGPQYLERAVSLYEDLGRAAAVHRNVKRLALLYQLGEEYVRAIEYFERALLTEQRAGNHDEEERILRNIAYNYWLLEEPEEAYLYARQAVQLITDGKVSEIKSKAQRIKLGFLGLYIPIPFVDLSKIGAFGASSAFGFSTNEERAFLYTILGGSLAKEKNFDGAIEYLKKKLAIYIKQENHHAKATSFNNIGFYYNLKGDTRTAWSYFLQSFSLCEKHNYVRGLVKNSLNLGRIALSDNQIADADTFSANAGAQPVPYREIAANCSNFALGKITGNSSHEILEKIRILHMLGNITLLGQSSDNSSSQLLESLRGNLSQFENVEFAIIYFEEALRLSRLRELPREEALSLFALAQAYFSIGEWKTALTHSAEARTFCRQKEYNDLLWQVDQLIGNLLCRVDTNIAENLSIVPNPMFYYVEAKSVLQSESEGHIDRSISLQIKKLHRNLYNDVLQYLLAGGDTLRALTVAEEMRAHELLDSISGERLALHSPLQTNLLNWARTFRKELTQTETQLRSFESETQRSDPRYKELVARHDSIHIEYNSTLTQILQETPLLESLVRVHTIPIEEIQNIVRADEIILYYFVLEEKLFIWIISPFDVQVHSVSIRRHELNQAVRSCLAEISKSDSLGTTHYHTEKLASLLLQPLSSAEDNLRQIRIVPDDILYKIPFSHLIEINSPENPPAVTISSSLAGFYYAYEQRTIGGLSLFSIGRNQTEAIISEYEARHFDEIQSSIPLVAQLIQPLLGANLLHVNGNAAWNSSYPMQSHVQFRDTPGRRARLRLLDFLQLQTDATLALFDVVYTPGQIDHNIIVPNLERTVILSGTGTLLLPLWPLQQSESQLFFSVFYEKLLDMPPITALRVTRDHLKNTGASERIYSAYQLYGFGGMSELESSQFAQKEFITKVRAGNAASKDGDWTDAVRYYEEALAMAETSGDAQSVKRLCYLIVANSSKGKLYQKAIEYQKLLYEIARNESDVERTLQSVHNLASLNLYIKNTREAINFQNMYLSIAEEKSPMLLAPAYRTLGIIYEQDKQFTLALESLDRAKNLFNEQSDSLDVADCYNHQGRIYLRELDDYMKALESFEHALTILENIEQNELTIEVLQNLALTQEKFAEYQTALSLQTRALHIARTLQSEEQVGLSEHFIANIYWKMGDYQQALAYNRNAKSVFEDLSDDQLLSWVNSTRGLIEFSLLQYEEALQNQTEALAHAKLSNNKLDQAMIYKNIGLIYNAQKEIENALRNFSIAASIDSSLNSKRGLAYDHRDIGSLLLQQGDIAAAAHHLQIGLDLSRDIGDTRNELQCMYYLGVLWESQAQHERALDIFGQTAKRAERLFLPEVAWRAYRQIALLLRRENQKEESRLNYKKALEIIEEMRAKIKVEEYQTGFFDDKQDVYAEFIELLHDEGKPEMALNIAERARSRSFIDLLANRSLQLNNERSMTQLASLHAIEENLRKIQTEIAFLLSKDTAAKTAKDSIRTEELRRTLVTQRSLYNREKLSLRETDPELAEMMSIEPTPVVEIQKLMPSGSAILEYFITTDQLFIWVIKNNRIQCRKKELPAEQLRAQIEQFRLGINRLFSVQEAGRELYKLLIKPVENEIKNDSTLILIPHNYLHYVPFSCLVADNGQYLIERYSLATIPSATVLGFCFEKGDAFINQDRHSFKVLAMGNPTIAGDLPELPLAKKEVKSIERTFNHIDKYFENSATETNAKRATSNREILHFACHGEYNASNPLFSALLLSADGANDGRLEAHEIFSLNLNSYLVAMSACETGLSSITKGDELIGLSRSFLYAGATSLLSSLWKVDDLATAVLIKRFFRYVAEGDSRAEALRKAQLLVKTQINAHPAYWAAFQLTGDFR